MLNPILKELKHFYSQDIVAHYENLINDLELLGDKIQLEDLQRLFVFFQQFPTQLDQNHFETHLLLLAQLRVLQEGSLCLKIPKDNSFYQKHFQSIDFVRKSYQEDGLFDASHSLFKTFLHEPTQMVYLYFQKHWDQLQELLFLLKQRSFFKNFLEEEISEYRFLLDDYLKRSTIILNQEQSDAVMNSLKGHFSLIKGGPGTGKTTITAFIIECFAQYFKKKQTKNPIIFILGFTGRSVSRVQESLEETIYRNPIFTFLKQGMENRIIVFQTIHRFLTHTSQSQLKTVSFFPKVDMVIIDELSMVSPFLFARLLKVLSPSTKIVLLGDPYQLPSIEEGSLFDILLSSPQVFLQGNVSHLSRSIRAEGQELEKILGYIQESYENQPQSPFNPFLQKLGIEASQNKSFFDSQSLNNLLQKIDVSQLSSIVKETKPGVFWLDSNMSENHSEISFDTILLQLMNCYYKPLFQLIQNTPILEEKLSIAWKMLNGLRILSPINIGLMGCKKINLFLTEQLIKYQNPNTSIFPCLIMKNQHHLPLNNGDLGLLVGSDQFYIKKLGIFKAYSLSDIKDYEISFSSSIHKSQGSECHTVILVFPEYTPYRLLTRQILYTGLSRAKKNAIILADQKTLLKSLNLIFKRDSGGFL